ncbi:uncharacterized protein PITG_14541 [Phytophthora infestans T30-4]|uniref:Uncharacterized protein n=1 Tax=Phytophthora infestans (strain T30-4) TaxID=403677 RepID=D0NQ33_PHYIT|nr:uncharacterized protein PITG_14541 [Phytophthora infestans T30-4]EEY62745.1 hypothetical protein PITG_14541 [Phytophthora infestans T30-4]|eukprot:XP_002898987.1 hypothetical protein PITG_14541 [Phytophthora infestans T30-4]
MPTATAKAPTITAYIDTTAAAVSSSTLALKAISKMRRYFYDHVQHQPFRWMIGQTARFAQDVGRT